MPQIVHLYTPNTSKRANGNNSQYLGDIKVVKGKAFREDDADSTRTSVFHARVPAALRHLSANQLLNGLGNRFHQSCSCEHDCCGHYFGGVVRGHLRGRKLTFVTQYQRNI